MLCNHNDLELDGVVIANGTFRPADEDSVYAIYHLGNTACGVTVEQGQRVPYLRLTPAIQIPREGRGNFERFLFECDDETMVDLNFDANDGEITLRRNLRTTDPAEIERVLVPALRWIDEVAYPAIMAYIAALYPLA